MTRYQAANMEIFIAEIDDLPKLLPQAEPLIQVVLDRIPPETNMQLIKRDLYKGKLQMIVAVEDDVLYGLALLNIVSYPTGYKLLDIPVVSGTRMEDWLVTGFGMIKDLARQNNCKETRGYSLRKGWFRKLNSDQLDFTSLYEVVSHKL